MIRCWYALPIIVVLVAVLPGRAQSSPPHGPAKDDYSQEAAVIEELSTKVAFDNDGNLTREQTSRVRVQTDAGVQQWGLLKFPFQSATQTVEIDYVRVRKADGSTLLTPPDNVQDLDAEITRSAPFYSDLREKHVAVKGLGKGDMLEYEAHWRTTKPLIPGQFWFQYSFLHDGIVLAERLEIKVPSERAVKVKGPQATQTVTTDAGSRVYAWTYSKLQSAKEPGSDEKKETETARGLLPPPDVQISSFQSWEEVGRWYWNLQKDRIEPTPAIRTKAAELTKGMTDDGAKRDALYSFVSTHYRYIGIAFGIGRYQPHAAEDILTNNYGDCKDKHTLLASLLQASGITLYPALVNSSWKLDADVPSPAQFDHVIGYLPQGKDKNTDKGAVWLDTTIEVAPFGYLVPRLRDKQALVMSGDKSIQLITTPADPPFPSTTAFKIEGKLSDDGTFEAKIEDTTRGDSEVMIRAAFRKVPQPQWKDLVQQISYGLGYSGTVSDISASTPEAIGEPFRFSYSYNRKDYPDWKSDRHFTVPGLPFYLPPVRDDAKYPIWFGPSTETVSDSKVEVPKGYQPQLPSNVDLKYDFAEYHASYSQDNGVLIAKRRFLSKLREVPVAEFDDYRSFLKNMQNDINQYVQTSSSHAGYDLYKRGYEALRNGNYSLAIELLKGAVAADPKNWAWNELGLAYMQSGQDDLAISSFQKQIEMNPHHPYAPNNLGLVYLRQRKYEEAIKWFRKQIEINPLDKYAHANLGAAYLEQHKYQEAIPELEQAVPLTPDNPESEERLGEAYSNIGQDEQAMAAFSKAVKISDKPAVWNNIAYQLALKKAHLDVARRYAESAVTTTEATLRNYSLDQVDSRNIGLTSSLASYWDTLGWVEFSEGNLEKARKYVLAAWQLSPRSEEADHLGQIYEKQGENERATHFYALAMNARRPEPETRSRLAALAGGNDKVDPIVEKSREELIVQRTIKLGNTPKQEGKAEFILLLTSQHGADMSVDDVKFVSGDEKLKVFTDALRTARYGQSVPDQTAIKLLRRGTLSCTEAAADCSFLLALPEDVKSAD
jgi:tetratricopeptide (TPR) repeat protein/transglutaminase-like putative cysteine protease